MGWRRRQGERRREPEEARGGPAAQTPAWTAPSQAGSRLDWRRWSAEETEEALAQAEEAWSNEPRRKDRTKIPYVALDAGGAVLLDDGLWCGAEEGGGWRVEVAIVDVGGALPAGGAVDAKAERLARTVYLPRGKPLGLLPVALAQRLSLKVGEPRRVLATSVRVAPDGTMRVLGVLRPAWAVLSDAHQGARAVAAARASEVGSALQACGAVLRARWGNHTGGTVDWRPREVVDKDGTGRLARLDVTVEDSGVQEAICVAGLAAGEWLERHRAPGRILLAHHDRDSHYSAGGGTHERLGGGYYACVSAPIRRYADVCNQRAAHAVRGGPAQAPHGQERCDRLNRAEAKAYLDEIQAIRQWVGAKLQGGRSATGGGRVTHIIRQGLVVELDEWEGAYALAHESTLGGAGVWWDEDGACWRMDGGHRVQRGQRVIGFLALHDRAEDDDTTGLAAHVLRVE